MEQINLALQYEPVSPIYHYVKTTLLYNEGNFNMSLEQCKELYSLVPTFPSLHLWFFKNYYRLNDKKNALSSLQTMLEMDPLTAKYSEVAPSVLDELRVIKREWGCNNNNNSGLLEDYYIYIVV